MDRSHARTYARTIFTILEGKNMKFFKKFDVEAMNTLNGRISIYATAGVVLFALIRLAEVLAGGG